MEGPKPAKMAKTDTVTPVDELKETMAKNSVPTPAKTIIFKKKRRSVSKQSPSVQKWLKSNMSEKSIEMLENFQKEKANQLALKASTSDNPNETAMEANVMLDTEGSDQSTSTMDPIGLSNPGPNGLNKGSQVSVVVPFLIPTYLKVVFKAHHQFDLFS